MQYKTKFYTHYYWYYGSMSQYFFLQKHIVYKKPQDLRHKVDSSLQPSCSIVITNRNSSSPTQSFPITNPILLITNPQTHLILSPTLAVRLAAWLWRNWGGVTENVRGVSDIFRYCFISTKCNSYEMYVLYFSNLIQ